MSFAVWLTGHSGSGKSAIARELLALLPEASILESDVMRTQLTPHPRYDDADRGFFYGALADFGVILFGRGRAVIFDATANRRAYRDAARQRIARFAEVFVDTPLEVCVARDPKGLYAKGMNIPYEPPLVPELVVRGDRGTPRESAQAVIRFLESRGWIRSDRKAG